MGVRERSEPESHLAIEGHHASLRDARVRGVQCEMACCPSRIFVLRIPVDLSHDLQQASRLRYIDISIFG
jgi:hypothetical protein